VAAFPFEENNTPPLFPFPAGTFFHYIYTENILQILPPVRQGGFQIVKPCFAHALPPVPCAPGCNAEEVFLMGMITAARSIG
jgi:hypothetical protein